MKRILIVDDEEEIQRLFEDYVEMIGYESALAKNGKEALNMVKKEDYDLVVTDLKMPEMDGVSFMKEAKKLCPELKFVILTGYSSQKSMEESVESGSYVYLEKPVDYEDFKEIVRRVFKDEIDFDIKE